MPASAPTQAVRLPAALDHENLPSAYRLPEGEARGPVALHSPRVVFIEVTNHCNLLCETCPRTFVTYEQPQTLAWENFVCIVEQFPAMQRAVLHGIGEPLINKNLPRMIEYLKARGATVLFNTNATLLDEEWARALIASELDELRRSLDGADPQTYAHVRGAPLLHKVVQNLKAFTALQRELNVDQDLLWKGTRMPEPLRPYLDFTVETAYLAGRLTLGYYQTGLQPDMKLDDTPVTIADRKAEELIRSRIEKHYPRHAIIGEEHGAKEVKGATHRWIVDPIDGTKAFMRGVPLYGVLIGLEIDGQVQVGAAYFPALDEMVAAATGEGCWWNGRRAHVSTVTDLKEAYLALTDVNSFDRYNKAEAFQRLVKVTYHRAGWSDAYGYAVVATGRAEIMLDPIMNVWDCGPFPPILQEAGGYFGNWQGHVTIYAGEALATTQTLLPQVLHLLRGEPA